MFFIYYRLFIHYLPKNRPILLQWTRDWPELPRHALWPGAANCWRMGRICRSRISTRWRTGTLRSGCSKFPRRLFPLLVGKTRNLRMARAIPGFDPSRLLSLGVSQTPGFPSLSTKCGGFADTDNGRVQCNPSRHDPSCMSVSSREVPALHWPWWQAIEACRVNSSRG